MITKQEAFLKATQVRDQYTIQGRQNQEDVDPQLQQTRNAARYMLDSWLMFVDRDIQQAAHLGMFHVTFYVKQILNVPVENEVWYMLTDLLVDKLHELGFTASSASYGDQPTIQIKWTT